jgi:hypothetical protein
MSIEGYKLRRNKEEFDAELAQTIDIIHLERTIAIFATIMFFLHFIPVLCVLFYFPRTAYDRVPFVVLNCIALLFYGILSFVTWMEMHFIKFNPKILTPGKIIARYRVF